jgi:indolepyruvate decarboxylase
MNASGVFEDRLVMTTMLFAYGTLIPRDDEELRREGWVADAVRGRLYDLGRYPALIDLDDSEAGWVLGYVRPAQMDELEGPLDIYEEVSGAGLFRRVQTRTRAQRLVWLYVYSRPVPPYALGPIECWRVPAGVAGPRALGVGD